MAQLRRFAEHTKIGRPNILAADHPAVLESRSRFTKSAGNHSDRVLISGFNSKKIGARCAKGKWSGFPIFTLTLEERKTCPRTCMMWRSCYGNSMHWSRRNQAGLELEDKIEQELTALQAKYPLGFIVRLHVLGDFYSVAYVNKWAQWLDKFSGLRVFGYTARELHDPIGTALCGLISEQWERFAVRSSFNALGTPFTFVTPTEVTNAIVCPAQTQKSECCATCGLCWNSTKPIAFLEH